MRLICADHILCSRVPGSTIVAVRLFCAFYQIMAHEASSGVPVVRTFGHVTRRQLEVWYC